MLLRGVGSKCSYVRVISYRHSLTRPHSMVMGVLAKSLMNLDQLRQYFAHTKYGSRVSFEES